MSEGDVQRSFENELVFLSNEDVKIDEFEKLYVITAAMLNNPEIFDENAYNPENFDRICNFAEYKLEHQHLFKGARKQPNSKDMSFYTIPITVVIAGKEEECYVSMDSNMNALHIILPNGNVIPTDTLKNLTDIQTFVDAGALTEEEAQRLLNGAGNVDDIARMIEEDELDIILIREKAMALIREKGLDPEAILKEAREKDLAQDEKEEEELAEEEELTDEEKDKEAIEDAERAGFEFDIIQAIAAQKGCKVHQIRLRELYREDIIKERTGKDLKEFKGRVAIARITYGFKEEMVLVDKTNGRILSDDRRHDHELEDLVPKWPRGTKMPIRKDEGRSYITYIDKNGAVKETKFLNNGKKIDMSKEERERFLAEVAEADKRLSEAITEYQSIDANKDPKLAQEKWKNVSKAMAERIAIDKKYDALRNQREVTATTLLATIAQTIGEVGLPGHIRIRKENVREEASRDDDEDPRLARLFGRDPRW